MVSNLREVRMTAGGLAHLQILEREKEDVYRLECNLCHGVSLCGARPLLVVGSNRRQLKQTRSALT